MDRILICPPGRLHRDNAGLIGCEIFNQFLIHKGSLCGIDYGCPFREGVPGLFKLILRKCYFLVIPNKLIMHESRCMSIAAELNNVGVGTPLCVKCHTTTFCKIIYPLTRCNRCSGPIRLRIPTDECISDTGKFVLRKLICFIIDILYLWHQRVIMGTTTTLFRCIRCLTWNVLIKMNRICVWSPVCI